MLIEHTGRRHETRKWGHQFDEVASISSSVTFAQRRDHMPGPSPGRVAGMNRVNKLCRGRLEVISSIAGKTFCAHGMGHGPPGAKRRCMSTQR